MFLSKLASKVHSWKLKAFFLVVVNLYKFRVYFNRVDQGVHMYVQKKGEEEEECHLCHHNFPLYKVKNTLNSFS